MLNLFYSNSFKYISDHLQEQLFTSFPFTKKVVIIPNQQIKEILIIHFASKIGVCLGITWLTLDEALKRYWDTKERLFPTYDQLYLALAKATEKNRDLQNMQLPFFVERLAQEFKEHIPSENKEIWDAVFSQGIWTTYYNEKIAIKEDILEEEIHLVGFSFIPKKIIEFFFALAEKKELFFYLFSPCRVFWEDILSDKEIQKNLSFFQKKKISQHSVEKWFELVQERNPLLASLGKVGRESLKMFPDHVQERAFYEEGKSSLLGHLQNSILLAQEPPKTLQSDDSLLLIDAGEAKYKELERLNLLLYETFSKDPSLKYSDVTVYAPNINLYSSLIGMILDFPAKIEECSLQDHSPILQGILAFINLLEDPFSLEKLLFLWANPTVAVDMDIRQIREIFDKMHIKCAFGHYPFSLEEGFKRIVRELSTMRSDNLLDISSYDWLNDCLEMIYSLQKLILYKKEERKFSCKEWIELINTDIFSFFDKSKDASGAQAIGEIISSFVQEKFIESTFPFSILMHLFTKKLSQKKKTLSENNINAITFRSLKTDSVTSSSVIAVLGMEESSFPRKDEIFFEKAEGYFPMQIEKDRYLFLQILLSAKKDLWLFYRSFSEEDGKEQSPSLLVEELLSYLDKYLKKGESIKRSYPLSTYHPTFHQKECSYPSLLHYKAALRYLEGQKERDRFLLFPFSLSSIEEDQKIALHKLRGCVISPFQHFLTYQGIYLEKEEMEDETFFLPNYQMKQMVKESFHGGEALLDEKEKEGFFPGGVFSDLTKEKIKQHAGAYQKSMQHFGLCFDDAFELDLMDEKPFIIDGQKITFAGTLSLLHPKGILLSEKYSFENALKSWPYYLLYQWLYPNKELFLFFLEDGKKLSIPFSENSLITYLRYFVSTRSSLFPFPPSSIASFVQGKQVNLQNPFDRYARWLFKQKELVLEDEEIWRERIKEIYQPLMEAYGI